MAETLTFETLPVARLLAGSSVIASGVPEGLEAAVLVALARLIAGGKERRPILHIARDGQRLAILEDALQFFAPDVERLRFPAWDGVAYHRQRRVAASAVPGLLCQRDATARFRQCREHGRADRADGACRLWPRRHRDRPWPIFGEGRHPRFLSAGSAARA